MPSPTHAPWFSLRKYILSTPAMALLESDEPETSEAIVGQKRHLLLVVSLKTDPSKRNRKAKAFPMQVHLHPMEVVGETNSL